jgi:alkylation response protein AidB-like acyl-CoA dehydrogenase
LLSEEHEEFRAALRRFAEKEIAPHAAEVDEREAYPKASMDAFRDSRWSSRSWRVRAGRPR